MVLNAHGWLLLGRVRRLEVGKQGAISVLQLELAQSANFLPDVNQNQNAVFRGVFSIEQSLNFR